jgi:hypothetical protein
MKIREKSSAAGNRTWGLPYVRLRFSTPNIYCAIFRCRVIKYIACLRTAEHAQIEMSPVHPVKLAYNFRVHAKKKKTQQQQQQQKKRKEKPNFR